MAFYDNQQIIQSIVTAYDADKIIYKNHTQTKLLCNKTCQKKIDYLRFQISKLPFHSLLQDFSIKNWYNVCEGIS